jgi:NAD(P) transhydrogenase subunit beta
VTTPPPGFVPLAYLSAAILFIVGLKRLSSPATARSGNLIAAGGMALAVIATLLTPGLEHRGLILTALSLGAVAGFVGARRVLMTDMPQMVALLNGLGGGAAALVSTVEFVHASRQWYPHHGVPLPLLLGTLIGAVSFSGSLIAFGKLQGLVSERSVAAGVLRLVNAALATLLLVAGGVLLGGGPDGWYWVLLGAALVFGSTMVIPIGGADMPVVISLLNSCTGLAAAATGFTLDNTALIISGTLVGASGTLLTQLMCKAMNRSLANVLFSGFGAGAPAAAGAVAGVSGTRPVREIGTADAAVLLANIRSLIIIPGYGMAVAQAQHVVRELADLLAERGVDVKYAIHPVAGRMPGHMNVLLAEANVPYPQLFDLEQINDEFERADVALVIGANDVVNPSARTDRSSPIYGMPILNADKAQHTIVIKRGMSPGFAGIDNPLYYEPKTLMLFGDAKGAVTKLVGELKAQAA